MCFDAEMSYTQFIRKQIITVNYSSQLKTRESALILIAFSTMQFPSTLSAPLWIKQENTAQQPHHSSQPKSASPPATQGRSMPSCKQLTSKSPLQHSLAPGMLREFVAGAFYHCFARAHCFTSATCSTNLRIRHLPSGLLQGSG